MKLSPAARSALRSAITSHYLWDEVRKARNLSLATMSRDEYLSTATYLGLDAEAIARKANAAAAADAFKHCPTPAIPSAGMRVESDAERVEREAARAAARAAACAETAAAMREAATPSAREFPHAKHAAHVKADNAAANDDAARLAELLRKLTGGNSIDAGAVNALIDEKLSTRLPELVASLVTTTRIVLTMPNGEVRDAGTAPRHSEFAFLLSMVGAGLNMCLVGEAGSGKTTAAQQVAETLGKEFYVTGAARGEHEYLGFVDAYGKYHTTAFRQAFENGGVFCADELDAGDPSVPLILNSALANGVQSFPDSAIPVRAHPDFLIIACANTFGTGADRKYVGRVQLDAATLDRFAFLVWNIDEKLERAIAPNADWCARVQELRAKVKRAHAEILVTPRATINGAKALAAGADQKRVEDMMIWKGTDAETRRKVEMA